MPDHFLFTEVKDFVGIGDEKSANRLAAAAANYNSNVYYTDKPIKSVQMTSPKVYVRRESCLTFFYYLNFSANAAVWINTTNGHHMVVNGDYTRTWRQVC